jgi:uncharacterized membrane protein
MSNGEIGSIVIGVAVVGLLLARQLQVRPVREQSSLRIALILGVIGIAELINAAHGHSLRATAVAWLALMVIVGAALGAVRAFTVKLWRLDNGMSMRQGSVVTAILWVISLGAHLAMESRIDAASKIAGFGASSLLLYLAVTYGVQREVVRWRATALTPA